MSSLVKVIMVTALFFALVAGINALPSCTDYPLPSDLTSSLALILNYTYQWSTVFTALNTLLYVAILAIALEPVVWLFTTLWALANKILARIAG